MLIGPGLDRLVVIVFASSIFLSSCTAGNEQSVKDRFPSVIEPTDLLYFATDHYSCTFATVTTSPSSAVTDDLISESNHQLRLLSLADPLARYTFPSGGFAYFQNRSLIDVASDFNHYGDGDLGYDIEEQIFSAKRCWADSNNPVSFEARQENMRIITDDSGIVVVGSDTPPVVIVFYPERDVAHYFGP